MDECPVKSHTTVLIGIANAIQKHAKLLTKVASFLFNAVQLLFLYHNFKLNQRHRAISVKSIFCNVETFFEIFDIYIN